MARELRNHKFRLYPTCRQETRLVETLNGCHWVYDYFLDQLPLSRQDMQFALTELKEQEPWLRNYHSKMLHVVMHGIDAARRGRRGRRVLAALQKKNGHKVGKLHSWTHDEYNSFTYRQSGFRIEKHGRTDLIWLSKIGYVEIRLHREPENIKQVKILRQASKWYALVACETTRPIFRFTDRPRKPAGIDIDIFCCITNCGRNSDKCNAENPLLLKKMLRPLGRVQRKASRRKNGFHNTGRAKSWVGRLQERIANKRRELLLMRHRRHHRLATKYASRNDAIFLERLHISNAVRDNQCNRCGLVIYRDYNAGLNTFQERLMKKVPQGLRKSTPRETVRRSRKQEESINIPIASPLLTYTHQAPGF